LIYKSSKIKIPAIRLWARLILDRGTVHRGERFVCPFSVIPREIRKLISKGMHRIGDGNFTPYPDPFLNLDPALVCEQTKSWTGPQPYNGYLS